MMLSSRGLAGALRQGARLNARPISTRSYLTALNPRSPPALRSGRLVAASSISIAAQARLASTTATPAATPTSTPPTPSTAPPPTPSTAPPPTSPTDALATDSNPFDLQDAADFASMPERIGYLKDIGLDYGWGPTSMVEYAIEHIHIYSGLPWWGSIAAAAFFFRLSLVPLFVKSADAGAKMRTLLPITKPLQAKMMEAFRAGDSRTAARIRGELQQMNKAAGISNVDIFIPALMQGVFGFCAFRLLRAMASLPVPGLETGGFLWISDLTQADPYFLLPAAMATTMHLVFRMGGEAGTPMNEGMKPIMLYILPGIVFVTTAWLPAALDIWLTTTGLMGIIQVSLFKLPAVRSFFGMSPLISNEQAIRDASAAGYEPPKENTINVKARSRPAGQKPMYQAPKLKFASSNNTSPTAQSPPSAGAASTAAVVKPPFNPIGRAKEATSKWVDNLRQFMNERARAKSGIKQSKTRSEEYMKQAIEYERRWQKNRK